MKLLKFLTVGRSFSGVKDANPYRVVDERAFLPHFGSDIFQEVQKPKLVNGGDAGSAPPISQPSAAAAPGALRAGDPTARVQPEIDSLASRTIAAYKGKRVSRWKRLLRAVCFWKVEVPVKFPTRPHPFQSELCLEKVQVVRNDLAEADLVVQAVAAAGGPSGSGLPKQRELPVKSLAAAGEAWMKTQQALAARFADEKAENPFTPPTPTAAPSVKEESFTSNMTHAQ